MNEKIMLERFVADMKRADKRRRDAAAMLGRMQKDWNNAA